MEKKVYVVGNQTNYADFINDFVLVDNMEEADIVLFTGGEDVNPSLYKCKRHPTTGCNPERDKFEKTEFTKCKKLNKLAIGICRGSQFLCTMNGGILIQDCVNHAIYGTHPIINTETGEQYEITSTHHQMQFPFYMDKKDYTILYKAEHRSYYFDGDKVNINLMVDENNNVIEPEIVLYHKEKYPKCLAIQGHPEYMRKDAPVVIMINELINNLLNK